MQSRLRLAAFLCLSPALLFVTGCTKPTQLPQVSGSVVLKRKGIPLRAAQGKMAGKPVEYLGEPVEQAKVTFMQGGAEVGFGVTDAAGRFRIKSVVEGEERMVDGLPAGAYQVKINRLRLVADPAGGGAPAASGGPKPSLPAKYADPETSELEALVIEPPAQQDPSQPPPNFFAFVLEE